MKVSALIIFLIACSLTLSAQVLEVSREKNAALINKYLAAKNLPVPVTRPAPMVVLPPTKYAIELRNVPVPVEFTYVYFSYKLKPKNHAFHPYKFSSK